MTEAQYDGFRFEVSRPDVSAPGGVLKVHYIAVAKSTEDAKAAILSDLGRPSSIKFISRGPSVLTEARQRGLADGDVSAL
jgi:hypothetical protein